MGFAVAKDGEEARVRELLDEGPLSKNLQPRFLRSTINEGFRVTYRPEAGSVGAAPAALALAPHARGYVFVSETEIFGRERPRRPGLHRRAVATSSQIDQLLDFSELVEGDFVVHVQHGIAVFRGLTRLETAAGIREVISLEFDDKVTLHVPLQEAHLVSRYVGLAKARPQLGRIGTGRWEKTRAAAEHATLDLAAQLLEVQARRAAQPGYAFAPDTAWQRAFEASFPFAETPDQLRAIGETKNDMEQTRPMDRLVCGDVGFGKTEVAIRAAFKAVMSGRQVAVLVPTTVLAQQHFNTFRERMAGYPVAIEMLSRFRSPRGTTPDPRRHGQRRGGHPDRHPSPDPTRRSVQGPGVGGGRRGTTIRRQAQGGVQTVARACQRAVDERNPDSPHAIPVAYRRARPERH